MDYKNLSEKEYKEVKTKVRQHVKGVYRSLDWMLFYNLFEEAFDDGLLIAKEKIKESYTEKEKLSYLKTTVLNEFTKLVNSRNKLGEEKLNEKFDTIDRDEELMETEFSKFILMEMFKIGLFEKQDLENEFVLSNAKRIYFEILPVIKRQYWILNRKITDDNLNQLTTEDKSSFEYPDFFWAEDITEIMKIKAWVRRT